MNVNRFILSLGALSVGSLLLVWQPGPAQPPLPQAVQQQQPQAAQDQEQGMEVLARGPVHEAFAEPVNSRPQPGPVILKQPPDPIEELPPDQKPAGDNVQWIPGYWAWSDDRSDFIWVSGVWRIPPPGEQWVPGHWDQVTGGWQWSPGFWAGVQQDQLQYLPPPPEPVEESVSTVAPAADSVLIPGNWVWRDTRYLWRPGYYVNYQPGWVWVPAHYVWTPCGYVYVEGYWDLDLERRGLLFAPVYFERPLWKIASWSYRPQYAVYTDFLFGSLFVRQGYCSYYFGDFFEPAYRKQGFVAWLDYKFDRHGADPLFSYYRWEHRANPRWQETLTTLYAGRTRGELPRPPRTLTQQQTVINNITVNKVQNVTINDVRAVAPLSQVSRQVALRPVTHQNLVEHQQAIRTIRDASRQRGQAEVKLIAQGATPTRPQAKPQAVHVALPRTPVSQPNPTAAQQVRPTNERQPATERLPRTPMETKPRPEPTPRVEPRPQPQPRVEPRPQPRAEPPPRPPHVEPRPEPRPQPRVEPRPQPRPEVRPPVPPNKPEKDKDKKPPAGHK